MPVYLDVIDRLAESDAHFAACVAAGGRASPFRPGTSMWRAHAAVAAQLLVGCINRRELVAVLMDVVSTPRGHALDDTVRRTVNRRLGRLAVVSAICLDSRSTDLLQVADLVAGAVLFEGRSTAGIPARPGSPKAHVAAYLGTRFGAPGLVDGGTSRVNIATFGRPRAPRALLRTPQSG